MVIENDEVEVDLDDDAGLDEDPLAGDVDSSWRGKKRRRAETLIKESEAEAKRLREELAAERAASRDLTARVGKLEGVASALVDEDIDDPFESELTDLHDERKSIQKQWYGLSAKARDEQQEAFEARMAENEAKRTDVAVRRALSKREQEQAGNQVDPEIAYQRSVLQGEYGDVFRNSNAAAYADGYWRQAVAKGGDPRSLDLRKEAAQAAREALQTSTKKGQPNDPSTKARYTGTSSTGGPGSPNTVKLTASDRMMADARFPNLPEKQRYRRFAEIKRAAQKKG